MLGAVVLNGLIFWLILQGNEYVAYGAGILFGVLSLVLSVLVVRSVQNGSKTIRQKLSDKTKELWFNIAFFSVLSVLYSQIGCMFISACLVLLVLNFVCLLVNSKK